MHIVSVNRASDPRPVPGARGKAPSGIFKESVSGPVAITVGGVRGDNICNTRHHGGQDQAVYVYGTVDYDWWSDTLGRPLDPGIFGENLTIAGLSSGPDSGLHIGDRLHIGAVVLEVTAPRIPCNNLAARLGEPNFVVRFRDAERSGLYCRVITEGQVEAGDEVTLEPVATRSPPSALVSVIELLRSVYDDTLDAVTLRRFLAAPIAERARVQIADKLARMAGST